MQAPPAENVGSAPRRSSARVLVVADEALIEPSAPFFVCDEELDHVALAILEDGSFERDRPIVDPHARERDHMGLI